MLSVRLNGEPRHLEEGATVASLLDSLGLNRDGVAVAVNRRVVPRSEHSKSEVPEGAEIEVIRAVGGG